MDPFEFEAPPSRIVFGENAVADLAEEADRLGIVRALVLCSPARRTLGDEFASMLEPDAVVCDASAPNMPESAFERVMADIGGHSADGLIAVGGGSPIGLGKAVAAATRLPFIAIATTYSGSEMAPNWYVGTGPGRRQGIDRHALPATVIYDPALTLGLSPAMSAASGMNAIAHAAESLYGPDTNPVIQTLAEEGIRRLAHSLPSIVETPGDLAARGDALYGAWLAAAFRAKSGLHHVIAQRVRHRFDLGHAETHAVVLPYAIAFNRAAAPEAMRRIERALAADDAARGLHGLNRALGLAVSLEALGMDPAGIDEAADIVAAVDFANPRPASRDEVRTIIAQAMEGSPPPT